MSTLRKMGIALALTGGMIAFASPAKAQNHHHTPPPPPPHGGHGGNGGNGSHVPEINAGSVASGVALLGIGAVILLERRRRLRVA